MSQRLAGLNRIIILRCRAAGCCAASTCVIKPSHGILVFFTTLCYFFSMCFAYFAENGCLNDWDYTCVCPSILLHIFKPRSIQRCFCFFDKSSQKRGIYLYKNVKPLRDCQFQPLSWTPSPSLTWVSAWASMIFWSGLRSASWSPLESECRLVPGLHQILNCSFYWRNKILLTPSLRYIPAIVDHSGGLPCHGTYLLHQVPSISTCTL